MTENNAQPQGIVTPLDAAMKYAGHYGLPVFPCGLVRTPNGRIEKKPLVKWATVDGAAIDARDPDQITALWQRAEWIAPRIPGLIAIVVSMPTGARSGLIVLDIDVKDGRNGFDTLDDLGAAILPDTPISHTTSGGVHVFFACTGLEIRNSAGTKGLGIGIDIRGDGGQVVLPSPNSGYWWDPHCNLDTVVPIRAPAWLGYHPKKVPSATASNGTYERFNPTRALDEACNHIRSAGTGDKYDAVRRQPFIVGCLVRDGFLEKGVAWHSVQAAVASLEKHANDITHMWNAARGAFQEGLDAPERHAARRASR